MIRHRGVRSHRARQDPLDIVKDMTRTIFLPITVGSLLTACPSVPSSTAVTAMESLPACVSALHEQAVTFTKAERERGEILVAKAVGSADWIDYAVRDWESAIRSAELAIQYDQPQFLVHVDEDMREAALAEAKKRKPAKEAKAKARAAERAAEAKRLKEMLRAVK